MGYNIPSQDNSGDVGDANFSINKVNIGNNIVSVPLSGSIQDALDYLNGMGGGIINLRAGTYNLTDNLTFYSNIRVQGVGSNATILDFGGLAKGIRIVGTSMAHLNSVFFNGFTVQNSTVDLVYVTYIDTFEVFDMQCYLGASGFNINNATQNSLENIIVAECTAGIIGVNIENFADRNIVVSTITGGNGIDFTNVLDGALLVTHVDTVTGNGIVFTNCDDITVNMFTVNAATGIGFSIVTNAVSIGLNNGNTNGNGTDGMKIAGGTNVQVITCISSGNGRYGINVSNVQCINTLIATNIVTTNVTAAVNNSGTYTLIRSNIGVADN